MKLAFFPSQLENFVTIACVLFSISPSHGSTILKINQVDLMGNCDLISKLYMLSLNLLFYSSPQAFQRVNPVPLPVPRMDQDQ